MNPAVQAFVSSVFAWAVWTLLGNAIGYVPGPEQFEVLLLLTAVSGFAYDFVFSPTLAQNATQGAQATDANAKAIMIRPPPRHRTVAHST